MRSRYIAPADAAGGWQGEEGPRECVERSERFRGLTGRLRDTAVPRGRRRASNPQRSGPLGLRRPNDTHICDFTGHASKL